MTDPRIARAFALVMKSFEVWRSERERDEFRFEAWEILEHIFNS